MRVLRRLTLAVALVIPSTAYAAAPDTLVPSASSVPSELRLSDAEVEQVLDTAARKREASELPGINPGPQIHGEMGFGIGTGGYRSAFGTAIVPLGGDGVAILSFDSTDFGSHHRWVGPWR